MLSTRISEQFAVEDEAIWEYLQMWLHRAGFRRIFPTYTRS